MARRALVEILADASGFVHGLKQSSAATHTFSGDLSKLAVNAKASAAAQVQASVRKTERLRVEVAAYKQVAASAKRGSSEQVAAANLAARAEGRLAASMGAAAHEAARLRGHAGGLERDLGRASRGALAGSGIFRGLGRSIAFASGGFLAFATGGQFIRTSIDAAKGALVTQKQLGQQLLNDGKSFKAYRGEIDQTNLRLSALSGFTKDDLDQSLTTILRTTSNVSKALRDNALAADIARARHIGLSQAALIVAKTEAGNTTLLRRQGFQIAKTATAEQALAFVRAKVAGQAKAGTTQQEKFGAVLHDSEVIIGAGLLPTLNQYLARGAAWLTQMNESGRLQKDVAQITKDVVRALHDAGKAAKFVQGTFRALDSITGSFENTLKDLAAVWLILKTRMAINWATTAAGISGVGTQAEVATGKLATLRAGLMSLNGLAVAATILIIERKQIAKGLFHIPGYEKFAHYVDTKIPALGRLDRKGGVAPEQIDPNRYGQHAPPGYVPGSHGKRQSTPENPGGYIAKSTVAPKGYQPGTYGKGMSTPENPGGFLPIKSSKTSAATTQTDRKQRPVSLAGQFNIDELKLADAERKNQVALQRSILVDEERITLRLRDQAKSLKDRTKWAQQAASLQGQIDSIDQQGVTAKSKEARKAAAAAKKKAAAAAKAAAGDVPLSLQLAQAKADAIAAGMNATDLTKGQIAAAKAIRNAEYKAIRSHKLSMQGLIDAWTEIGSINQQLASQTGKGMVGTYHHASTKAFVSGLGLTRDQEIAIRQRAAQRDAHRGYVPSGPAALGMGVHIEHLHVHANHPDELISKLQKKARQGSPQTRGRHGGHNLALS